jgi:Zn-dependent alcohol dehydrogenase
VNTIAAPAIPSPATARPSAYKDGKAIYQWYGTMATFAEYATGSEFNLVKIPSDMPVDRAALIACGVIAGYGAMVNRAKVKPITASLLSVPAVSALTPSRAPSSAALSHLCHRYQR